jgi:hypothetical protein
VFSFSDYSYEQLAFEFQKNTWLCVHYFAHDLSPQKFTWFIRPAAGEVMHRGNTALSLDCFRLGS